MFESLWSKFKPVPRGARMKQVVTREWVEAVQEALVALANGDNITLGNGLRKGVGLGRVMMDVELPGRTYGGGAEAPTGAFYRIYTVSSEDATNGDIRLQGGQVTAGSGNATIADFLLYDISTTTWAGTAGQLLQLTVNGDGDSADGVLMPSFDLTSASAPAAVASIAANTLPIVGTLAGVCRISLGTFGTESFNPALPGNINVSFCFGGFTISRF